MISEATRSGNIKSELKKDQNLFNEFLSMKTLEFFLI